MVLAPGFIEIDGHVLGIEFWKDRFEYNAMVVDTKTVQVIMYDKRHIGAKVIGTLKTNKLTSEEFCQELKRIADKYMT